MRGRVVPIAAARQPKGLAPAMPAKPAPAPIGRRPAIPVYAVGRVNRCPDCHGEAFTVGRITAECGGCGLPLPVVSFRRVS